MRRRRREGNGSGRLGMIKALCACGVMVVTFC